MTLQITRMAIAIAILLAICTSPFILNKLNVIDFHRRVGDSVTLSLLDSPRIQNAKFSIKVVFFHETCKRILSNVSIKFHVKKLVFVCFYAFFWNDVLCRFVISN